ncbi:putative glyoxalase family protein [Anopheles sinensis]|uniref:Putative glyoxalase family protein n=1 Tax=Anopheles sinensis TaxID=74873 RepID=A0A084WF57_ANOSI|nr:putative glyoxalase family protein [Anopheles sinensis]
MKTLDSARSSGGMIDGSVPLIHSRGAWIELSADVFWADWLEGGNGASGYQQLSSAMPPRAPGFALTSGAICKGKARERKS